MGELNNIFKNSFYQLLILYSILILLISFTLIDKFTIHFEIFALTIAVLGISIIPKIDSSIKINKILFSFILVLSIFLIIFFRFYSYINNSIPLGYDAGIYRYGINYGLINLDNWIISGGFEPGFLYLMEILKIFFETDFILKYVLIFFCLILGGGIYYVTKEFFDKNIALIAIFIYSISFIQILTFSFLYYKNIIALCFMLFSILFLNKSKKNKNFIWLFIIFAGLTGALHRATFYILGLSYFFYAFFSPYKNKIYNFKELKNNILYGVLIIILAGSFYLGIFQDQVLVMFAPVLQSFVSPGEASGTFISFFSYQFRTLFYLPFAILGFFALIKKRNFNILFFLTLITGSIVYFQFFFFNRFIIHLDIFLIILSAVGINILLTNKKKMGAIIVLFMLFSGFLITFNQSIKLAPLIKQSELNAIYSLNSTESDSYVLTINSRYSPFVLGYSDRLTIAPGLFDYNLHSEEEWSDFVKSSNITYINEFMNAYKKPLYIFIGEKDNFNEINDSDCFSLKYKKDDNFVYKYLC